MLLCGSAKKKPLYEVPMAIVDYLQMKDALPKNPKAMKINLKGSNTLEICRIKIISLRLVKSNVEGNSLACWIRNCGRTAAVLKLRGWSYLDISWT